MDVRHFATESSDTRLSFGEPQGQRESVGQDQSRTTKALSNAMQTMYEFRKYIVCGFDSCTITKGQYDQIAKQFQVLDHRGR